MKCEVLPIELKLKNDFIVAGGKASIKNNFIVILDNIGLGEAAGSVHYGVDDRKILEELSSIADEINCLQTNLDEYIETIDDKYSAPTLCAISTAWHDLQCKNNRQNISEYFSLPEPQKKPTSLTVSVGDLDQLKRVISSNAQFVKLKMNNDLNAADNIIALINQSEGTRFRIDANGSWDISMVEFFINNVRTDKIELIEQPFDYEKLDLWTQLRSETDIPIFMDESINSPTDIKRVAEFVDGVNIKIQKTGRLETAIEMIKIAKQNNLKTMIGCMIESSIGIAAAYSLSGMADFIDLDGALLIENDPFDGLSYNNQYLNINGKYGHGITLAK
ncbi:MAG: enolase C-terminal domain-like protein [candidate division Zixibacteria bacterium]